MMRSHRKEGIRCWNRIALQCSQVLWVYRTLFLREKREEQKRTVLGDSRGERKAMTQMTAFLSFTEKVSCTRELHREVSMTPPLNYLRRKSLYQKIKRRANRVFVIFGWNPLLTRRIFCRFDFSSSIIFISSRKKKINVFLDPIYSMNRKEKTERRISIILRLVLRLLKNESMCVYRINASDTFDWKRWRCSFKIVSRSISHSVPSIFNQVNFEWSLHNEWEIGKRNGKSSRKRSNTRKTM